MEKWQSKHGDGEETITAAGKQGVLKVDVDCRSRVANAIFENNCYRRMLGVSFRWVLWTKPPIWGFEIETVY